MSLQLYHARVDQIRNLTHDVREIGLRLTDPAEIHFKAGQFVSFDVPHPTLNRPATRAYSIASPPIQKGRITLLLNLVPGGPGSTYLFGLKEGDATQFKGPAGSFYLKEDGRRDLLFVATGTGIAPFCSMLDHLLESGFSRSIILYWGLRSQRDLYYQKEFEALAEQRPNVRVITTLSRPEPGWTRAIGRVTKLVAEQVTSVANLSVYLCGNSGMIGEVSSLITQKGLCPIRKEKWYDDAGGADPD
jgi:CDP-4-dehydro-6-deoxyglucose reductase, E3